MKVHKPPALANGGGYSKLWFIRSLLIASGVPQLDVNNTNVEEIRSAWPDAKQWLPIVPQQQLVKTTISESVLTKETKVVHYACVSDREQGPELWLGMVAISFERHQSRALGNWRRKSTCPQFG